MKKITLFLTFSLLCFSGFLSAQHNFGTVAGPVLVAQATPVTININDVGNTAGVPASPTGTYTSFSVSVDWSDNFDAWSSEADLSVITTAGTVLIDPATTGSANSGNATTMTFVGEFTAPYNPTTDGFLDILLRQSFGGSSANWSNIVVTIFPAPACIDPAGLLASNITPTSVDLIWTDPSGTQFDYEYVVQAAGVGMPAGAGNYVDIGDLPLTEPGLTQATLYEFWVRADCGANGFSNWVGPVNFRTSAEVVCGTPINTTHCYTDNDTTTWAFTSDDGSPLRVTFNAGGMESCCDEIIIYDGSDATGAILYQGNNGGNLAGLTFDSTTDSIYIVIDADVSVSCGSGGACCTAQFDFTVACATCVNPIATFTNVPDCANGEYSIDVNLTDLGSATSVSISDGTTTLININTTGVQTFGPYADGSSNTVTVTNEQDSGCFVTSGVITYSCPPANDDCANAIALTPGGVFGDNDIVGTNVAATGSTGETAPGCASYLGGDVWYSAVVPASGSLTFELNTDVGGITDGAGAVYSGTCGSLVLLGCNDSASSDPNDQPLITVTGRTPGEVLYFRVWEYGNNAFGTFLVSAYDASLSSGSFDNNNFMAYPNPVKDVLNLSYTSEISTVRVMNMLGQEVISRNLNATTAQVDMSQLSAGTYIVNVTIGDTVKTIKVVKQ